MDLEFLDARTVVVDCKKSGTNYFYFMKKLKSSEKLKVTSMKNIVKYDESMNENRKLT